MHNIRWDDLQYVLTVANEGSLSAAARALGVNHSTVLRRIDTFEYRHKLRIFHKLPTGYKLTVEGQKLLESALAIESTVRELEHKVFGQELKLEGTLRITTTDALSRLILGTCPVLKC
ncbi:LysR family transcriptional regulator, partial [Vibrio sp. 10N.222.54.F6]